MNYDIKNIYFKIKYDNINNNYSLIKIYHDKSSKLFKITKHLGDGTYGKVYLIEDELKNYYALKISTIDSDDTLIDEVRNIYKLFKSNNIKHSYYPICYGEFRNDIGIGIIYPYLGEYNLETVNGLTYNETINIIKEIINQLKTINQHIVHSDLKSSNIVLDDKTKNPTIIDFGLSKNNTDKTDIISTYYISSPESLLTLEDFKPCVTNIKELDITKHDYIGLFTIICSLFTKTHYWNIIYSYLVDKLEIKPSYLNNSKAIIIFVYIWYRFNYDNPDQIMNQSLYNLIIKIEEIYPNIKNKKFINFLDFFNSYIVINLKDYIDNNKAQQLYNILSKLIKFEPENRPSLDEILEHPLLHIL